MKPWSDEEKFKLTMLAMGGALFYSEIAENLGRRPATVRWMAKKLGLPGKPCPQRFGGWNSKHSHLREPVMRYFLKHSIEETRKKFGLTESEIKSLFTVGYRDPRFMHLRKDKRTKREWGSKDYLTLLRFAGLKPRAWISKKLKRGGVEAVRCRLKKLGISSKNLQGITISQFRQAFGCEPKRYVKTSAGPTRGIHGESHYKIILWSDLDQWLKKGIIHAPEVFAIHCSAMARFQKWIWKGYERKVWL